MLDNILFYGDPHGEYRPLVEAVRRRKPEAVVILGDFDAERPLEEELADVIEVVGVGRIWWIPGNHESDSPERYRNVFRSELAEQNLHGRVVEVGGVRIAGLGGVFRGQVWYPRPPEALPRYHTREAYVAALPRSHRFQDGLPLKHRTTIFPEDVRSLARQQCDVLVTHEGPAVVEYGFPVIGALAEAMGARALVHGHLHVDYAEEATPGGVLCVGCADRQAKWGSDLAAGLTVSPGFGPR